MPDPLVTALLSVAGTLVGGLASGAFIPRWVVSWMTRDLRESKAEALATVELQRKALDVKDQQLNTLLSDQQLSTAAITSLERYVRARDGSM